LVSEQNGETKVSDPVSTLFKTRKFTTFIANKYAFLNI